MCDINFSLVCNSCSIYEPPRRREHTTHKGKRQIRRTINILCFVLSNKARHSNRTRAQTLSSRVHDCASAHFNWISFHLAYISRINKCAHHGRIPKWKEEYGLGDAEKKRNYMVTKRLQSHYYEGEHEKNIHKKNKLCTILISAL